MDSQEIVRLKHMFDATESILSFAKGKTKSSLSEDDLVLSAIIRKLEIIGEAATKISNVTKKQFPELPWKEMVGMRNRLIHAYDDIEHTIVWKTIREDVPLLNQKLRAILEIF